MIDEFQDTSVLQYKILKPLIDETFSGIGQSDKIKSFFYVGDTKQSIYRFRGGKKELYSHLLNNYHDNGLIKKELNTNYRSMSNIIEFVNRVFENKIEGYFNQEFLTNKIGGYVSYTKDEDLYSKTTQAIDKLLEQGINSSDIAILVSNNKEIVSLSEYLKLKYSFDISNDSTSKLINQQSTKAIIQLLKYLYFKEDYYRFNFLSILSIKLDTSIQESYEYNKSIAQNIYNLSNKYTLLDDNMLKLIEIVSKYRDIHEFIYSIDNLSDTAQITASNGLKIMTIHKSKGLEFEHLIVLDILSSKQNSTSSLLFDYNDIELANIYYKIALKSAFDKNYQRAIDKDKSLQNIDEINRLYVAFTRAKTSLQIIAKEKKSMFDILNIDEFETGEIINTSNKESINTQQIEPDVELEFKDWGRQDDFITQKVDLEQNHESIYYGLALHEGLEMMDEFDTLTLDTTMEYVKNRYESILGVRITQIHQDIISLIKNSFFQELIKDATIYKEFAISYKHKLYYIDLLLIKDNIITIVDYKSSSSTHYDQYTSQLKKYKDGIATIYPDYQIKAYLVFIHNNIEFKEV
jgi:exodeoxyribonuclease V beta subunit